MPTPTVAYNLRYRQTGESAWVYLQFPADRPITLTRLARGIEYQIELQSVGENGRTSAWVAQSKTVSADATLPPDQRAFELDIVGGQIALDGTFRNFRLTLGANVTGVLFTNVPPATTLVVEIEQWSGGGNTIAWPANVVPVSGTPHEMTPTAGAVDIVTLQTTNGGVTWYQTVFQAGSAYAGTISPSPATGTSSTDGVTGTAPSVTATMTTANASGVETFAWARDDSGGTDFQIDNAAIAGPTFSIPSGTTAYGPVTQRWRCTATDAAGNVCQALVDVTLARTMSGGLNVTLSPNPAMDFAVYPDQPSVTVTPTVTGATGSVTGAWSRIDANGGSNMARTGHTFSLPNPGGTGYVEKQQTWRYTVTDSAGTDFDDVAITLVRDI